jgi:hypothetical protein
MGKDAGLPAQQGRQEESEIVDTFRGTHCVARGIVSGVALIVFVSIGAGASGEVVHRDIDDVLITIFGGQLDIDGDAVNDFLILNSSVLDTTGLVVFGVDPANGILGGADGVFAQSITINVGVGTAGQEFSDQLALNALSCSAFGECFYSSPLSPGTDIETFVGVQFMMNGSLHNGMVGMTFFTISGSILIQEFLYESVPEKVFLIPAPGATSMLPVALLAFRRARR